MATVVTQSLAQKINVGFVCGQAPSVQSVNAIVSEIAKTDIPILLIGESGTGKEVYARLIHRLSRMGEAPLKKVNCAALNPESLTAQVQEGLRPVHACEPNGAGTLFLDRVDELDLHCQRALLSLLPDGEQDGEMIVRVISSTSNSLEREIDAGRFRRELYFRISGVILRLPPLRERKEDISALLECFFAKHASELKKTLPMVDGKAQDILRSYDWPGNIRELENVAKKMITLEDWSMILSDLRAASESLSRFDETGRGSPLKVAARAASRRTERELILQALERTHWNRKRAAQELQISYKSLLYKIKQIDARGSESGEL